MLGHRKSQHRAASTAAATASTGYEYLHVMIDDHTRLAYAEVLDDLTAACAIAFLRRARRLVRRTRRPHPERVMSDNGSCLHRHAYAPALRELGLRHLRIRPERPRTNGKAERLIQTLLNEWAYARIYGSSHERTAALATLPRALQLPTTTRQPQPPTPAETA